MYFAILYIYLDIGGVPELHDVKSAVREENLEGGLVRLDPPCLAGFSAEMWSV